MLPHINPSLWHNSWVLLCVNHISRPGAISCCVVQPVEVVGGLCPVDSGAQLPHSRLSHTSVSSILCTYTTIVQYVQRVTDLRDCGAAMHVHVICRRYSSWSSVLTSCVRWVLEQTNYDSRLLLSVDSVTDGVFRGNCVNCAITTFELLYLVNITVTECSMSTSLSSGRSFSPGRPKIILICTFV